MTDQPLATPNVGPASSQPSVSAGMRCLDTSRNPRIPVLMEMVGALSRATEPQEVLTTFARGVARLEEPRAYMSVSTRGLPAGQYRITRWVPLGEVERGEFVSTTPWENPQAIPVHEGGFIGQLIRSAYPEIIHHLDVQDDPVLGDRLTPYNSLMAIPLFDHGEPLNWAIFFREEPDGFTEQELEESILRSNLVGNTVRQVQMAKELREAHELQRLEVEKIASIQRALLPDGLPDIPGVSLGASYATFDEAGGDMYTLRPMRPICRGDQQDDPDGALCCDPNGPWGILIADASGHGPAAAVVMAMMHAIIEAYPHEPSGPAEVLEHANRHLFAKRIESSFVTALFGIFNPESRTFTYARAGHNPPVHMAKNGSGWQMQQLNHVGGVPLGILDHVEYEEHTIQLDSGQTIVFYTDGITEAKSPDGAMFGLEGIERSLTECTGAPECVIGHVTGALKDHEATVRPQDDQTLVVMRVD